MLGVSVSSFFSRGAFFRSLDNEESKKREREEEGEDDDEEEIDEAKQKELDDAFLDSCLEGSLKDVKRTLRAGAFVNAQDDYANNALNIACWRAAKYGREGTFDIVKFLLSKRCSPSMTNEVGRMQFISQQSMLQLK